MATKALPLREISLPLLLLFLAISVPKPTEGIGFGIGLGFGQWRTLLSLSHSLMNRVANVRDSRGDFEGAERARKIAEKMEGGFGFWGGIWWMGWDYVRNYEWKDLASSNKIFGVLSDVNELLVAVNELTQMESEGERATWMLHNYQRIFAVFRSILRRFLVVFARPGPLREMVLIVQKEAEGDLLRDCLEVGANDLKGLLQVAKDIALNFVSSSPSSRSHSFDDL